MKFFYFIFFFCFSFPVLAGRFHFHGNKRFSNRELKKIIEDSQNQAIREEYADTLAQRLEDEYLNYGYLDVQIDAEVVRPKTEIKVPFKRCHKRNADHGFCSPEWTEESFVRFNIQEGKIVRIKSIEFRGQRINSEHELHSLWDEAASGLLKYDVFVEKDFRSTQQQFVFLLQNQGFLSAKILSFQQKREFGSSDLELILFLEEGVQTRIEEIQISGISAEEKLKLIEALNFRVGDLLNISHLTKVLTDYRAEKRKQGFLDSYFLEKNLIQYSNRNSLAKLNLDFFLGPKYRIGTIQVEKLNFTESEVIRRELLFQSGEIWNQDDIDLSLKNITALGVCASLDFIWTPNQDPVWGSVQNLVVNCVEADPGVLSLGAGIRNDLGFRVFGEIGYLNLWKKNHIWTLRGDINRRLERYRFEEFQVRMSYFYPWFIFDKISFRPELNFEKRQYFNFDASTFQISAALERVLWPQFGLSGSMTYSLEQIDQFNAIRIEDEQVLRIGSMVPALKLDLRDHPLTTTKGVFASLSMEYAAPFFGSQISPISVEYFRTLMRTDFFIPVVQGLLWTLGARAGTVHNLVDSPDSKNGIPLIKQFSLGGVSSLRGFDLQEINTGDQVIRDSLSFVNFRTQFEAPILENFRIGPFLDIGNLSIGSFWPSRFYYTTGLGLKYQTPVGPLNLDWGFKINPEPGTDTQRIHLSVGIL